MNRHRPLALVTGCAGFIGSHVCEVLLGRGVRVVGLDNLSTGRSENLPPQVDFHEVDLRNDVTVDRLMQRYRPDFIFHFSAFAAERFSHQARRWTYENNIVGSANLINSTIRARTVKCLVFASSAAVYGCAQRPWTERTVPQPIDPYGVSKLAVEHDLRSAHEVFGLNSIVFRLYNVFGERQNARDDDRNVVMRFIQQGLAGHPFSIVGDGRQTRAFTYVASISRVIALSVFRKRAWNQCFNLGARKPISILKLSRCVAQALGVPYDLRYHCGGLEARSVAPSVAKARREFAGLLRPLEFAEGLANTVKWARLRKAEGARRFFPTELGDEFRIR